MDILALDKIGWVGKAYNIWECSQWLKKRQACNTLEGLFGTLCNKFKPQYKEAIKSLQFRKLYRYENENVEEWMARLHVAAVECNYQEIDSQLKEQFIHSLNDKPMLEEIIKELTVTSNDSHLTMGGILAWAKRVEKQKVQAAVLDMLTESRQFDKVKISKRPKEDNARALVGQMLQQQPCLYCGGLHMLRQCLAFGKTCMGCGKTRHFKKVCCRRRERVVNEIEVEVSQEYSEGGIETVSIDSVHLNKNLSLFMVELETCAGVNKIVILYKKDMGNKGNIMTWHIFKRLFKSIREDELKKTIRGHITLRTYNKTVITQLGTCVVMINFKNIKKGVCFL